MPIEFHDALKRLSAALRDDFPVHNALADAFGPSEAVEREFERLRDLLENTRESERSAQDQIVGVTLEADELKDANEKLANWNHWRDTLDDLSLWDRLMGRW